ncbi:MAG: hypothetical protein DRG78_00875 [Epsilonproteobacteria bacterium]|nr:MAG: hypothetical protein DRG78_00875 [Campylobacterota bacterium]
MDKKEFDILITNFIDYDTSINLDETDSIYYYASAIKRVDSKYIVIKQEVNSQAIKIKNLAKNLNIKIIENPPLVRALSMEVEENENIPSHFLSILDEIYTQTL